MLSGLEGKVAVVTGGAGGLGAASALRLSREGCRVVVVDVDGAGVRKVAESLPGESIAVAADVSLEENVERHLREAAESFGRVVSCCRFGGRWRSSVPDSGRGGAGLPGTARRQNALQIRVLPEMSDGNDNVFPSARLREGG